MKRRYFNSMQKHLNVAQLIGDRTYFDIEVLIRNRLQCAVQFVKRLELDAILEGHMGCVNCLEWTTNGQQIASASDDFHLMIWDPFKRKRLLDLQTPHTGNIFSVKFLPKTNNSIVVTGAADNHVFGFDLEQQQSPIFSCHCHTMRVKRLATAPETPFLFWSSAEDGTVLQFDTREPHTCKDECNNVLINLSTYVGIYGEIKCIAINPRRPEMLAVGANDTYARVYDRRKIKLVRKTDSSRVPSDCVTYFSPGHFNLTKDIVSSYSHNHVTFSPDGTELLVNMSAEQIYLYDLNNAKEATFLNLPKLENQLSFTDASCSTSAATTSTTTTADNSSKKYVPTIEVENCKKLGNDFLENENYLQAINQYTIAIHLAPNYPILYLNRATALMRRKWHGDMYAALRDCHEALRIDPSYVKAHFRLARALLELGYVNESELCLDEFKSRFPNHANNNGVMMLKKDIDSAIEKNNKSDTDSNVNTALSEDETYWRSQSKDYHERFVGHCNTTTDIKEANFFGNDGNFIIAGSDDGNFFIWERRPYNIITNIYKGDTAIVNCVQPHPYICMLATSGIDHEIRLWTPQPEENFEPKYKLQHFDVAVITNQQRMKTDTIFDMNTTGALCRTS